MSPCVLVIGGAGYIGSHLCKVLAQHGYTPVVYDSLKTGHKSFARFGPFVQGDLLDKALLLSTLKTFSPLAVFHLASDNNTREPISKAFSYYQNNLIGTFSLLEALLVHPVPYLIFSSSASVYGKADEFPIKETSSLDPISVYGRTKLSSEFMIKDFCEGQNMHYAHLRYFNAAGADLDGELGESHDPETHLIPLLIQVLNGRLDSFSILGQKHKTEDGTAKRDFVHVHDLACGHIHALKWIEKEKKNLVVNLGSGKGHTILDIISSLEKKTKKKIPLYYNQTIEEPPCLIADIDLAKKQLNWSPKYSDLDTILETALLWHS